MRSVLLAAVGAIVTLSSGQADAQGRGPYLAGFYAGINGGAAWSPDSTVSAIDIDVATTDPSQSFEQSGGFGGVQIGYNWRGMSPFVLGVEADIEGSGVCGKALASAADAGGELFDGPTNASAKSCLDWFGTVRGRLGYALDRSLMFYATAGFAFGGVRDSLSVSKVSETELLTASSSSNSTRTGYVVGGGLEYAFSPAWSVKSEYQYMDLGATTLSVVNTADLGGRDIAAGSANIEHVYHTWRIGLNYHFGQ